MKRPSDLFLILFGILTTLFSGCDLFDELAEEDDSKCIIGSWERTICGGQKATIVFQRNGTGYFQDYECTGTASCFDGRFFGFDWRENGSGSVTLTYTSAFICGDKANIPTGGSQSYTCSGNTLTIGNTYSRK
jgi:hypothetical protein